MKKIFLFLFLTSSIYSYAQFKADSTYTPLNVAILLYNGVELLDFAGPGEVFQQANFNGKDAFNVFTVGVDSNNIISQNFLHITTQYTIDDCPMPDVLVIPGGNNLSLVSNEKLIAWISEVNRRAEYILSVCNGINLLAKTGDLDGMTATSHYGAIPNLIKKYPKINIVTGKRFVDNGRIITTEGVSAGIDGSLYLLSKMFNMEVANDVAKIMMYHWKPEDLDYIITQKEDTLFEKRISAFSWMPDGKDIILNVLKVDKTGKKPPLPKKFRFNISSETIDLLPVEGGGLAVSPDGNSIAYIKQIKGQDQIYLYNLISKEDKPLVIDTLKKYAISWSTDGKNLAYNIQTGKGVNAKVEICTYNLKTNRVKQITENSPFRRYTPVWNPKNDKILYTMDKGDKRDQIYVTDKNGSFHTNLTNDTTTHNYSPIWENNESIVYVQAPSNIFTMKVDGSHKQIIEEVSTTQFNVNPVTNNLVYLDSEGNLMLYHLKYKTTKALIPYNKINELFHESFYH
ncbi:MAG: DJ-1/PfpI family protein [Saprospiraceae bacterium]|nr:DJ-1/PfpI family protein [Saprospiraceae bacterium]MBK8372584.1 DJ-1/PfpI family protein [Saprospiraceae bacterium]MBK8855181.1 DJ-1/PfpI family protein [Saprospiraceae bacterium]MBK9043967.1 DJ-1/PfpI family protein [Saprospiraceae bacterium]